MRVCGFYGFDFAVGAWMGKHALGGYRVHARALGRCATYILRVRMRVVGSRRRSPRRGAEPSQTEMMAEMTTEEHRPHTNAQSYIGGTHTKSVSGGRREG